MNWRPRNETPQDLAREVKVAAEFRDAMGFSCIDKLSDGLYGIDYAAYDFEQNLTAWFEIKIRNVVYDPILLSAAKALTLFRWQQATRTPAYFVIHLPDRGMLAHHIRPTFDYRISRKGSNRGQNGDIEPCILITLDAFTSIAPPIEGLYEESQKLLKAETF